MDILLLKARFHAEAYLNGDVMDGVPSMSMLANESSFATSVQDASHERNFHAEVAQLV